MATPVADIRIHAFTGAGPTATNVDSEDGSGPLVFGRADAVNASSAPIPAPTATGTNYSWHKTVALQCVLDNVGGTEILNKDFSLSASPATGLYVFFKDVTDTYTQAAVGNAIVDSTASDGAVPATYSAAPETPTEFDADADAATDATRVSDYLQIVVGIGSNFAGGAANDVALPNLVFDYDEQEV